MKRSPIKRRTELKPRARIERQPRIVPAEGKPPRKRKASSKFDFSAAVKRDVLARSGGWCEFPGCKRTAVTYHHRLRRSQQGPGTAENCMHLCRSCHTFIHDQPALSYEKGWLLRSGNVM